MKNSVILASLVLSSSAFAQTSAEDPIFRPYLSCTNLSGSVQIEVTENVEKMAKETFRLSVVKVLNGKTTRFENLDADRIDLRHKDVLDRFEGMSVKENYRYQLTVMREAGELGNVSIFTDSKGRRKMFCNYHITFGN